MAVPPVVADEALGAFLVATLRARRHKDALTLISLPAPWLPLEPLWDALPTEPAMLWDPPRSPIEPVDATMTPDQALPHSLLGDGEASLGLGEVAADPESLAGLPVERLAPPGQAPGALRCAPSGSACTALEAGAKISDDAQIRVASGARGSLDLGGGSSLDLEGEARVSLHGGVRRNGGDGAVEEPRP